MPRPLVMEGDSIIGGQQRDAQGEDRFRSWRTLENFDTVRDPVISLKMRKGYDRWNATELAANARQIYIFRPTDGTEHVIAYLSDDDIYLLSETGAHTRIYLGNANMPARIPFLTVGDRLFWGTHTVSGGAGFFWTDATQAALGNSFQVGINAPTFTPTFSAVSNLFSQQLADVSVELDEGLAQTVQYSTNDVRINNFGVFIGKTGSPSGSVRLSVKTTSGGTPTDTLAWTKSDSDWFPVDELGAVAQIYFYFNPDVMDSSTVYAIVLEGDEQYQATYSAGVDYVEWHAHTADQYPDGDGFVKVGIWGSIAGVGDFRFGPTRGPTNDVNHYKFAYRNDYGEESPLSDLHRPFSATSGLLPLLVTGLPTGSDGQVTSISIYRQKWDDSTSAFDGIYYLMANVSVTTDYVEAIEETGIMKVGYTVSSRVLLLKENNYLIQPLQDEDENRLAPAYLALWNGRIWASPANSNTTYFSGRIEEENALGVVGDSLYDVYPANNRWDYSVGGFVSGILNFYDRLVTTFRDRVRVLRGGDSPFNPPADLFMEETINEEGSIDGYSMAEVLGSLVFVNSQKEVKVYRDGPFTQGANDINDSLWKPADIADTFMAANIDNQYWILVNRAAAAAAYDELWIFNASTTTKRWKVYRYDTELTSIVQLNDGTILASDAGSSYVLELNNTTSDNGTDITAIAETHSMMSENPRGRSRWNRISMSGNYPDANNFPAVTMNAIDRKAITTGKTVTPTGSDGVREHWTGLRVFSEECRSKITMVGISDNDIRRVWQGSTRDSAVISGGQDARRSV